MRELRVEDALLYLDQVKVEFGDRPHIYNEFLDIMKTFKTQQLDTPGVIRRVSNLFQGNKKLVLGFNTFLPEGYKIELPMDGEGPPIAVYQGPGHTITQILGGPQQPATRAEGAAVAPGAGLTGQGVAARPDGPQQMHLGQPMRHGGPHQQPGGPCLPGQQPGSMLGQPKIPSGEQQPSAAGGPGFGRAQMTHTQQRVPMQTGPRGQQPMSQQRAGAGGPSRGACPGQVPGGAGAVRGIGARSPGTLAGAVVGSPVGLDCTLPGGPTRMGPGGPHHLPLVVGGLAPPGMQAPSLAHQPIQQQQAPPQAEQQALQQQAGQQQSAGQPPLEFDHAINYVTTIKRRFSSEPETYKKFLEILHTYQKEQRGIKEVLDEVSVLFADHPDLLKEFTYFLPDAVQAQAKAQLDEAAKASEARKAARESKQAITKIAKKMHPEPGARAAPMQPRGPSFGSPQPIPTPFGASQGREEEREREIARSAHYGIVSFAPVPPPRRDELTPSQAAAKKGRPTSIPELPKQPITSESAFFDRAKEHLKRRELAPDKPAGSRRHTPHAEFLKCLHLFGAGIVTKEELVVLFRGLFMQGHAPKSGANAGGGVAHSKVATDAQTLIKEFEQVSIPLRSQS